MEPWDSLVTYALDFSLGGGAFYIGTSLTLYLIKRWNQLEVRPKQPQVNIPLVLKQQTAEAMLLEQQEQVLEAMAMPSFPASVPAPAQLPTQPPVLSRLELVEPELAEPSASEAEPQPLKLEPQQTLPELTLTDPALANDSDAASVDVERPALELSVEPVELGTAQTSELESAATEPAATEPDATEPAKTSTDPD